MSNTIEATPDSGNIQKYEGIRDHYDGRVSAGEFSVSQEDPYYEPARLFTHELLARELFKPDKDTVRMVELGCGVGYHTTRLLSTDPYFSNPSRRIDLTAIDVSPLSLEEYARAIAKVKPNINLKTINDSIGNGVNQIGGEIDNVMSTGVYHIPPDEFRHTLETLLPRLAENGAYIFQFLPPQVDEQNTGNPISRDLGDYYSYRYPKTYLHEILNTIGKQAQLKMDIKFIDAPQVAMKIPGKSGQFALPHQPAFCVIHRL